MTGELKNLPRLGDDALGPCSICGKVMLEAGMPVFYRLTVQYCAIDRAAVQERLGLALQMGGGNDGLALAAIMGSRTDPVAVMGSGSGSLCMSCAQDNPALIGALHSVLEESA